MNSIADQYYIKAIDQYPYSLDEAMENLNYALSYNPEHEGANYLMGKLCVEQFQNYAEAEKYYQLTLAVNPHNQLACLDYALLLIYLEEFEKAEKGIDYVKKQKGANLFSIYRLKGLIAEYKKEYSKAIKLYEKAFLNAYENEDIDYINGEIRRIKDKQKLLKKKLKKNTKEKEVEEEQKNSITDKITQIK